MSISLFKNTPCYSLLLMLVLSGCSLFRASTDESEQALYESASQQIDRANYGLAIERLDQLEERFPFGRYAQQLQLDRMFALYKNGDYDQALLEADRFARLNPDHPSADYSWYLKGMSYYQLYEQNSGLTGRGDLAQRSQQQGEQAFRALSRYLDRFPSSDYRDEALKMMVLLKDSLARHELIVADYYMRRSAWVAAAERAQTVRAHYPGVSAEADALVVLIESYKALGLNEDQQLALQQLQQQFPNHPTLDRGRYRSPYLQKDRWWLKLITLGWLS